MKLRVGGIYKNRQGETVKIISKEDAEYMLFLGSDSCEYHTNGEFRFNMGESDYDLIEEIGFQPLEKTTKPERKIIQIQILPESDTHYPQLLALYNDGTIASCEIKDGSKFTRWKKFKTM